MIVLLSIVLAGFSVVSALLLLGAWLTRLDFPVHTPRSVAVTSALMCALATLSLEHLRFFLGDSLPFETLHYRLCLFAAPGLFFLFCRSAVMPDAPVDVRSLLHVLPVALVFAIPLEFGLPLLLTLGAGYSLWFSRLLWTLRGDRRRADLQLLFFFASSILALGILALGFAIPWLGAQVFYLSYNASVGLAFAFVVGCVIAVPDLFAEVSEIVRVRRVASSLGGQDVEALARRLDLSSHQLSELLNRHIGTSFSRYLRARRIDDAKQLLVEQPRASVLSIGLETGFRSQSTFYSAFKEETGQSPGDWRRLQLD